MASAANRYALYPGAATPFKPRGELLQNEPLRDHTSWRVGGPAERMYLPADLDDLLGFLHSLPPGEPLFWLGLGSNLLVRDGGLKGTVICTKNRLKGMRRIDEERIYAEVGVPCAHIPRFCAEQHLSGAEFLAGIPGTLGGAVAMNAGAFGGETWNLVDKLLTVDRFGDVHERTASDYKIGYRSVSGPEGEWFLAAELRLVPGETEESRERIKSLLAKRAATQPINQPSCGSVFRNPPGDYAARLIESCGLKGYRIGGACVSEKHANFIVNLGEATARDVESLIEKARQQVVKRHGVTLETEVRIVGEPLDQTMIEEQK